MIASFRVKTALLCASMMTTAIAAAPATAQVQLASADAADDATMDSDAIIVTATRRAVSLADVPILPQSGPSNCANSGSTTSARSAASRRV